MTLTCNNTTTFLQKYCIGTGKLMLYNATSRAKPHLSQCCTPTVCAHVHRCWRWLQSQTHPCHTAPCVPTQQSTRISFAKNHNNVLIYSTPKFGVCLFCRLFRACDFALAQVQCMVYHAKNGLDREIVSFDTRHLVSTRRA